MNAIPMSELQKLSSAMSRCRITEPKQKISFILDRNDTKVGEINWLQQTIAIYEDYEYAEEVLERLGRFTDVSDEYQISDDPPVTITNGQPEMNDYGKQLYEKPTNIDQSTINKIIDSYE